METAFITLQEASNLCDYTQEYLSLRARQGKLQARKFGRNWVTTKKWLEEYVAAASAYKNNRLNSSNQRKTADPPTNLPVYAPEADAWEEPTLREVARRFAFWQNVKFAFAAGMVVLLVVVGVAQGRQNVLAVASDITIGARVAHWGEAGITELIDEYIAWLWPFNNAQKHERVVVYPESVEARKSTQRGVVVLPLTNENARRKEQIQQSFSDEVLVRPQDDYSGIITPVFRGRAGEDYFYILVPLFERE